MKRFKNLLFLSLSLFFANAQTVQVLDRISQNPITQAVVYSYSKPLTSITDEYGSVDLSGFKSNDTLIFEHIGYQYFLIRKSFRNA